MRLPFRRRDSGRRRQFPSSRSWISSSIIALTALAPLSANAISFTPAPQPNLDLSQLGRVALAGDFNGISLYQYEEQNEKPFSTNGSEALLARMPNGAFAAVVETDATIRTMCTFLNNGTMAGVVMGGNFTSLGNMESTAVALFNPNTSSITPLVGISGEINSIYCDPTENTVYVGGSFVGANSTNAIAWVGTAGWTNLPFAGFNGPVTSITKASNGHIIFGGSFTGLGNASTPTEQDSQIVNLSSANLTTGSSSSTQGFSDPKNIICKTGGADGAGNTWLLQDQTPGFWEASFGFGFRPTMVRLWNTHQDGKGTKTWRLTALPINGIMNLTYVDPATGKKAYCSSECPLSNDNSVKFQDFHFVNVIGMNAVRIDISAWYGNGGGLNGIELFQNDIFSYAIQEFNEPSCANLPSSSSSSTTGPWKVSPSHSSLSEYLTAELSAPITSESASVIFTPGVRESGHYSVNLYTPGCLQDDTCSTRGQVFLSGQMTKDGINSTFNATLYQTNNYDKYDQLYIGQVDPTSDDFAPRITMTPVAGQSLSSMTMVAQRVGFQLINSTGGLRGLYEFDPKQVVVNTSDFSSSIFNKLGASFDTGSAVKALATLGDTTYVGGNFSSNLVKNVVAINHKDATTSSLDGGLDGEVLAMFLDGTMLYVGGRFTGTQDNATTDLNNFAVYDTSKNTWSPLGTGVDGKVLKVVPVTMNVTGTTPEVVISVTGDFKQLNAFGDNPAVATNGFGVWVPSKGNWLRNLDLPVGSMDGVLSSSLLGIPGGYDLYGGAVVSSALGASGAATYSDSLGRFPVNIQASTSKASNSSGLTKRASLFDSTLAGVITGAFDLNNNKNITILAGHFTARAANGTVLHNLVFVDGKNNNSVSGLGEGVSEDSTFVALGLQEDNLFAGGDVSGTVNGAKVQGIISYNLATNTFNSQPPGLTGGGNTVSAIAVRPNNPEVYVGGSFLTAGSLDCPAVCFFSTSTGQWNPPGQNIDGTVNTMMWASESKLIAGGNLTINNTSPTSLAFYDTSRSTWDSYAGANDLPGPVDVVSAASSNGDQLWVAGTATNGSVYLMKYDGEKWNAAGDTLEPGTNIRGLQVFSLTQDHDETDLVEASQALMLTGSIVLAGFGSASAVLFNGTAFEPFALTTNSGNKAGTLSHMFTERQNFFTGNDHHMRLVFVVLIGLAISLALIVLLIVAGLLLDRLRKKREGYMPAPTSMYDRGSGMQRIPPEELLGQLGRNPNPTPKI